MIERELNYQPKGGMCVGCFKSHMDCSELPFNEMPPICKGDKDGMVIVKCTHYRKREDAVYFNRLST